ncbi:hypothetical protein [Luteolibacter soli]|uniref:Cytochrome c domain-containing protein n=1 Tax=Luteolibacter soli TaxID=3135280 RepID=A0ABU9ATY1_9BACT
MKRVLFCFLAASLAAGNAQTRKSAYELPPIQYSSRKPDDAVARLLKKIEAHEVSFKGTDAEILRAVLQELNVPVESQIVVFSKTSLQGSLIDPRNPRALYFSDSIYVGWMPGGLIEVASIDAELGPIYYSLDPQDARNDRRTFVRETECLRCHGGETGREIPSLIARSVAATERGETVAGQAFQLTDDATPFAQRWGGWYVTGYTGMADHLGNAFNNQPNPTPSPIRPTDLTEFFDTSKYLAATSDAGALLVFQHQVTMHNVLTRASHRSRRALMEAAADPEATQSPLASIADEVVDHLLFRGAAPLPGGIEISETFREAFSSNTPRTSDGDSLKDFSNSDRLFANRCSFLIYSESFSALPSPLKTLIFERLHTALQGGTAGERYAYLEPEERRKILAILNETLPEAREAFLQNAQ